MPEVDRRGFFKILRRADPSAGEERQPEADPAAQDPRIRDLADLTLRLLADAGAEGEERLAEGTLMTGPYDLVYMRVTADHIVFSIETGFSAIIPTKDVRAFDAEPPVESAGYGKLVSAVLRFQHPVDPAHVTRSHSFRFREDSPLMTAIREACDLPEPEPEPEPAAADTAAGGDPAPAAGETLT
jgi:hypothetical protein